MTEQTLHEAQERVAAFLLLYQPNHSDIIFDIEVPGLSSSMVKTTYPLLASDLVAILQSSRSQEPPGDTGPNWKVEQARRGEQTTVRRRGRGRPW